MKFRTKLFSGYGSILGLIVAIAIVVYFTIASLVSTSSWVKHTYEVIGNVNELQKLLVDMETGERGFLITGSDEYLEPFKSGMAAFEKRILETKLLVGDHPEQMSRLEQIHRLEARWLQNVAIPEIAMRKEMNKNTATIRDISALVNTGKGKAAMDDLRVKLEAFINVEHLLMAQREKSAENAATFAMNLTVLGTLLALLIGGLIATVITRSLYRQIGGEPSEIEGIAGKIAKGDLKLGSRDGSESTGIFASLQMMIESLNQVVTQANQIAQGDYSAEFAPRSEEDTLGLALFMMTKTLRELTATNQEQDWIKTGQSSLNNEMLGEQKIEELTQRIINSLADYLNAQVGVFYLLKSDRLVLTSSFAYQRRNNNYNELKIGEGLVGQAAREKKSILFSSIPDDHVQMMVDSGLGESKANNVLAVPLIYNDTLFGVIALGTSHEFTGLQLEFLGQVAENIGIGLNSAHSRSQTNELLKKATQQAEKLLRQQEELKVANEELEVQTKALTASEQSLRAQQEELRVTNEELEAHARTLGNQKEELRVTNEELETQTKALEEQRGAVQIKNRELERAKKKVEEKARALEITSKYKSEFLANMSHELRTPLNSLLILAEILKENKQGNLTEKEVSFAETIHKSGNELLNLINEVLDLAKIEAGKMDLHLEDVSLDELTDYVKYNFQHQVEEKGLTLNIERDSGAPERIYTDFQKVQQIVKNLLSNAIKFTDRGAISFRLDLPSPDVDFSDTDIDPGHAIAITVSDTGIGIPEEKQNLIFEAFQQADGSTSRKYGGTGLGLSISRELVKSLGGKLDLHSNKVKGCVFSLYLPLNHDLQSSSIDMSSMSNVDHVPQEMPVSSTAGPSANGKTDAHQTEVRPALIKDDRESLSSGQRSVNDRILLIIEDDPQFSKIVLELAREKGFKGLVAADGEIGLQMALEYKPMAIILDIDLPKVDGWMVMEELKIAPETRHIPVHFVSGMDKDIRAMKMGAIGFLTKPISQKDLEDAFQKIETTIARTVKHLLIVEDDQTLRESMVALISSMAAEISAVATGEEAFQLLTSQACDCLVMDLGLEDMSGFDLLDKIKSHESLAGLPVIVYTGKELSREEERQLKEYANSIIIKGAGSMERLLGEMTLFLHQVETDLPAEQQRMLKKAYDKDLILKDKTILLVDDDARSSFALSNRLEENSIKILRAFDGKDALQALSEHPEVDLILMDIMMPEMDGYETMQEIRKQDRFQKVPIIALTAKAMKGDKDKCLEAGANDYLPKPVDTSKLISLLRVWLFS